MTTYHYADDQFIGIAGETTEKGTVVYLNPARAMASTASLSNHCIAHSFPQEDLILGYDWDKIKCQYCHGRTTNDKRGNCSACGAPRT